MVAGTKRGSFTYSAHFFNVYSMQRGLVFGAGDPVENRVDWVFLLLKLDIAIKRRSRERKQANKPKIKIVSDNNGCNDKN